MEQLKSTRSIQTEPEVTTAAPPSKRNIQYSFVCSAERLKPMRAFQENVRLAQFSNYKIGGSARFFFDAKTEKDIVWAVKMARERKLPIFILAGGTNLLISDEGFDGLVLRPNLQNIKIKGTMVTVGTGVSMADLLKESVLRSFSGLEWAGGLPGTLGGAVRGNAGCFGGEIKDSVVSVRSFDIKKMAFIERTGKQCTFAYRDSIFKKKQGSEIIISATLKLAKGDKKAIVAGIKEKVQHRKTHHPLEYPNIGSIFKNVPLTAVREKNSRTYAKALHDGTLSLRGAVFSVKTDPFPVISAAKLISESGLRGVSLGGAMFSPKHPNFIVNVLGATSLDVKYLMTLAKSEVKKKFGVDLEEEVQMI